MFTGTPSGMQSRARVAATNTIYEDFPRSGTWVGGLVPEIQSRRFWGSGPTASEPRRVLDEFERRALGSCGYAGAEGRGNGVWGSRPIEESVDALPSSRPPKEGRCSSVPHCGGSRFGEGDALGGFAEDRSCPAKSVRQIGGQCRRPGDEEGPTLMRLSIFVAGPRCR